ncbi:acyl-CoA thioesterase [Halospeciosus flavus]|uniref:Acyl-CoA thioesterase n=1 Tax=Halospeciosus flavus TaxID=3032283 RepID=A0ABD5Z0W8_9EURY|nr:thioesterase family protein [Halospeciosus flavus]
MVPRRYHEPSTTEDGQFKSAPALGSDVAPRTFTHDVAVQFRDLDTRAHVNHVVYAAYFERGKERLFEEVLDVSLSEAPTVVRSLDVDYLAPIGANRTVTVALGPVETGETSLTVEYELRTDDEVVATGRTVSVYLGEDGRPASLPTAWRDALEPYGPDAA